MSKTIELTQTEILNMLPSSWADITLETFMNKFLPLKISDIDDVDDIFITMENSIKVASIFLNLPSDIIRQFPISTIKEINKKLLFLAEKPKPLEKSEYRWIKKIEEPSYDIFILYLKVSDQMTKEDFSNLPAIIKNICLDELNDEQILQMKMSEVETGFFLLRKCLMKLLQSTAHPLVMDLEKNKMETKLKKIKGLIRFKKT